MSSHNCNPGFFRATLGSPNAPTKAAQKIVKEHQQSSRNQLLTELQAEVEKLERYSFRLIGDKKFLSPSHFGDLELTSFLSRQDVLDLIQRLKGGK